MDVRLRSEHRGQVARIALPMGQEVTVEADHFMAASHHISPEPQKKRFGGFFDSSSGDRLRMRAQTQQGWVDVSGTFPGEVVTLQVRPDNGYLVPYRLWLAYDGEITVQRIEAGESDLGFAHDRVSGHGTLLLASYGTTETLTLSAGEKILVRTGHALAINSSLQYRLRADIRAFEFTGPGRVLVQSRNIDELRRAML